MDSHHEWTKDRGQVNVVANVWDGMSGRRAVLLTPSQRVCDATYDAFEQRVQVRPRRMSAHDVSETLDGFTATDDAILTIAGRYDGLDLPDDDCRLLVMSESPSAIGELERHLREYWRLGPLLQSRERTRIVQGLGRCTRNATDFAVVIWLGESLSSAAAKRGLVDGFPPDLRAELRWGMQQKDSLAAMALGLLADGDYRKNADALISELRAELPEPKVGVVVASAEDEVHFARLLWEADFPAAYAKAREIADQLGSDELAGYRAWWLYLASIAAHHSGDAAAAQECLSRAAKCGVNSGWLRAVLATSSNSAIAEDDDDSPSNAESVWRFLEESGWVGETFAKRMTNMQSLLAETAHARFHEGLEMLGKALGAATVRTNEQGAPDVVWTFPVDEHVTFEAKSEKDAGGTLSKADTQQATGHADWLKAKTSAPRGVATVVVSPTHRLHELALPHATALYHLSLDDVRGLGERAKETLGALRVKYFPREYAAVRVEFGSDLRAAGLDTTSLMAVMRKAPILDLQ